MALRKDTDPKHRWEVAVTHQVSAQDAAYAVETEELHLDAGAVAEVQSVYCGQCRRAYDDVADQDCSAATEGYEHLVGGPLGRRRRNHDHDCKVFGCNPQLTQTQIEALRLLAANITPYRREHTPERSRRAL